ncbi:MAG: hypothetical protein Q8O76_02700 [Chloroflexota bacterium]|nr:hypothetical protein [Chloroflexota bacterium]
MLTYWALRLAIPVLPLLPQRVSRSLAYFAGYIAYWLSPRSRAVVRHNMRHALGKEVDRKRLEREVQGVFRHSALNYLELVLLPRLTLGELQRRVSLQGEEHFLQALGQGKGVIIATAHLGNFDLVVQLLVARSLRLTALVEPLRYAPLLRLMIGLRSSKGLTFLAMGPGALKSTIKALRRGEIVAVACDRCLNGKGMELPFLGEHTTLPCGAVDLAMKTGAVIIPAFSERQGEFFTIHLEPPIRPSGERSCSQDLRQPMEQIVAAMEKHVRHRPEQWVMFQPLWGLPRR